MIMDGVGDEANSKLGGKTPLEAANTPNLDWFAKKGKVDYCFTVKEGVAPESSSGVLSLLGYDPSLVGRGTIEALGAGLDLKQGDLAFRTNFATVESLESGNILDRRAGRTLSTKEGKILAASIKEEVKERFKFDFKPTVGHRGVLVFRGGFSDNISGVDLAYKNGIAVSNLHGGGKLVWSKGLDDEDDSKLSADLINGWMRHSHEVLDGERVNADRVRKGLYSANFVLCRGPGSVIPRFKKLKGRWIALGYMPLEKGIAKLAGMDVYKFRYPELKGIDVYDNLYAGLNKAIKNSIRMIKRNKKKKDYFYVHFKETDTPGHDGKPLDKKKMIELIDKKFFSYVRKVLEKEGGKLIVTGDHATSCRQKAHTADAVPVLNWPHPKEEKRKGEGNRFTESEGKKGRKIMGKKLLAETGFFKK